MVQRMNAGLHSLQHFADRHDSRKKGVALSVATVCIGLLAIVCAAWSLVQLGLLSFFFNALVAGLAVVGFHATRTRKRPLLGLVRFPPFSKRVLSHVPGTMQYVVCMAIVVGWSIFSLILGLIGGLLFLSLDVVSFILAVIVIVVEGTSVLLAYSLYKDLDPNRVVTLGSHDSQNAMEVGEEEFNFGEDEDMVHDAKQQQQKQQFTTAPTPVYQQTINPNAGTMPVYNPATGTYGGYVTQATYNPYGGPPQMVGYPPQQYAYPASYAPNVIPTLSPAPSAAVAGAPGDMFQFAAAESRPVYENDIIAPTTGSTNQPAASYVIEDDEFDPFQEKAQQ
jgi:uncharacterized membrane protein